jgi:hypothetical protein
VAEVPGVLEAAVPAVLVAPVAPAVLVAPVARRAPGVVGVDPAIGGEVRAKADPVGARVRAIGRPAAAKAAPTERLMLGEVPASPGRAVMPRPSPDCRTMCGPASWSARSWPSCAR